MRTFYMIQLLLLVLLTSCQQDDYVAPIRDWENTATYFTPTDEHTFGTYYKPYVGYVGDPMPFYDSISETFKVLYLQDYRPNPVGTYHPIWGVETKDAAHYVSLGEIIPCGTLTDQDAAIGTGSTAYNPQDGLYYTFYTGNRYQMTANDNAQVVMMATSSDFATWTKSRTFFLKGDTYGYSKNDFRDPHVFVADDGLYHMVVSTTKAGRNVLAEFTSTNLQEWEHRGVFLYMHWDRFYECPDVFKMGDWWYLVYSDISKWSRKVAYYKAQTLEELRHITEPLTFPDGKEGVLDSRGLYAGKTASNGTNRYLWGWCPTRPSNNNTDVGADNEPEWAGNLVAHQLVQHEDGTLSLTVVDAIEKKYDTPREVRIMEKSDSVALTDTTCTLYEGNYILFNRLKVHNKISFTVKADTATARFGVSLCRGIDSEKYYSIVINPEDNGAKHKINFEEEGTQGQGFVAGIDSYLFDTPADNTYNITICTDNSICVVYINGIVNYTNRIYGIQNNPWSINCYTGNITVSDLQVSYY